MNALSYFKSTAQYSSIQHVTSSSYSHTLDWPVVGSVWRADAAASSERERRCRSLLRLCCCYQPCSRAARRYMCVALKTEDREDTDEDTHKSTKISFLCETDMTTPELVNMQLTAPASVLSHLFALRFRRGSSPNASSLHNR